MDRSPGFGSIIYDFYRPFQTRFHFGSIPYLVLNLAIYNNSLDRSTKSTISRFKSLYLLVNIGFQVLFHSPPGVLFTVPSRYLFSIGYQVVFSLTEWSPLFHTRFLVSRTTLDLSRLLSVFIYRTFTFFGLPSLVILLTLILTFLIILTPYVFLLMVWALPGSLATTSGIVFTFFSYGYLDVSVPHVPLFVLLYLYKDLQSISTV